MSDKSKQVNFNWLFRVFCQPIESRCMVFGNMDKLIVAMRTIGGNSLLFCGRAHLLDEHICCVVDELRVIEKPGKSMTAKMRAVS